MRYFALPALTALLLLAFSVGAYNAQLIDPLYGINSSVPLGVGIVSYGLGNIYYQTQPYQVETNEVVGYALIRDLAAFNASPPQNTSQYGATVQLNVVMNVTDSSGNNYAYWLQNVMDLNTSNHTYYLVDNIWNLTNTTSQIANTTLYGYGNTTTSQEPISNTTNVTTAFYAYSPNGTESYNYPFTFIPVIQVKTVSGKPVAMFGYKQNGTVYYYDNVTFNMTAASAFIEVTPYYTTPENYSLNISPSYYDAELVVGGEASGEVSYFGQADAELWMGYLKNNALEPFPVVADFASDTAEAAQNLAVYEDNGSAFLTTGLVDYSKDIKLSGVPAAVLSSANGTGQVGTTSIPPINFTTIPISNVTTSVPTTTVANASQPAVVAPESDQGSLLIGGGLLFVILLAIYLLQKKMKSIGRSGQIPPVS